MKDIALEAGVHPSTVSLALSNSPKIAPETGQNIRELAERMGYVPDPALSSLIAYRENRRNRSITHTIGMLIDLTERRLYEESAFYPEIVEGATRTALWLGYRLEVFWIQTEFARTASLERVLYARNVPGLILGPMFYPETRPDLKWDDFALIKINLMPHFLKVDAVMPDQAMAVYHAMRELRNKGHRRIGLAVAELDELHNRRQFSAGWFIGQSEIPVEDGVAPFIFKRDEGEVVARQVREWAIAERLDAVLSNWNNLGSAVSEAGEVMGAPCVFVTLDRNPDQIGGMGMNQNHRIVGQVTVERLVGKIRNNQKGIPDCSNTTLVEPTWIGT
jgi:LacI family transcriptional regulator